MKYLVRKILIFISILLLLSNAIASNINNPKDIKRIDIEETQTLPIRLNHISNFMPTAADVHNMERNILSILAFNEAFEQPSYHGGRPLFYHISRRHILNYLPTADDRMFGNALFDIAMSAQKVKAKIKEIIVSVELGALSTSIEIENGVLVIKMQIKAPDLVIYDLIDGEYKKSNSGYIIIVVKKAWLKDHWSENLIPVTIFPSARCVIKKSDFQISLQNASDPLEKIFKLYQNTEFDQYRRNLIIAKDASEINDSLIQDIEDTDISEDQEIDVIEGIDNRNTVNLYSGYKKSIEGDFVYEGYFIDGEKSGQGKLSDAKGVIYDGEWKGNVYHGHGILACSDGGIYAGDFKYGSRHGSGILTNAKIELLYEGEWKNDLYNGFGTLYTLDDTYKGRFVAGKRSGVGTACYNSMFKFF